MADPVESYSTDAWEVVIHWGRDITGNEGPDTQVHVRMMTELSIEEAAHLGHYLLEKCEGEG